jgi:isopenicillin-N epimerase
MNSLSDYFLLDPSITFLNHGSFGATPIPVFEEYQRYQRELENEPVEFLGRQASPRLQQARQLLADYLHAQRDEIVFVPNATHGINIVAHSLDLHPGDEVLTTDHEYGAMDRTWQFLSQQKGFTYRSCEIPLPLIDKDQFVNHFFSQVTPHTRVIYLSHITSPTALIFPIREICNRARELNILTVIDGAHAPGQIELDLSLLGADFYTGNCHKWLCAPKGSAFLYAKKERQHLIQPLVVSWGWHAEKPGPSQFVDYLEWTGTDDISSYLSVPAAIEFQSSSNWPQIRSECHELAIWVSRELTRLFKLAPLSSSDFFAQMVAIPLPVIGDPVALQQRLFNEYHIEVPIVPWKEKTLIRVSVQGYNDRNDLEKLLLALKEIYKV